MEVQKKTTHEPSQTPEAKENPIENSSHNNILSPCSVS